MVSSSRSLSPVAKMCYSNHLIKMSIKKDKSLINGGTQPLNASYCSYINNFSDKPEIIIATLLYRQVFAYTIMLS